MKTAAKNNSSGIRIDLNRRNLAKAIAASPLFGLTSIDSFANTMADADTEIADYCWNIYTGRIAIPDTEKNKIGFLPRHTNRQAEDALLQIAKPIMATSTRNTLAWRTGLVQNGKVNAITPGGGVILVYDGLVSLCKTEAELASVIAHEVGHVEHRHAIRRIYAQRVLENHGIAAGAHPSILKKHFDSGRYGLVADKIIYQSYKRLWEHQADAYIIRAFSKLGYSMQESHSFFTTLMANFGSGSPNLCIYSTHPLTQERVSRLKNLTKAYPRTYQRGDSEAFRYLKSITG